MPYRGFDIPRQRMNADVNIFQQAGQTATWQRYVSASAGNPTGGIGASAYMVTQTITALFAPYDNPEVLTQAGLFSSGLLHITTREHLGRNDVIKYRNSAWRVYSDGTQINILDSWQYTLKLGN